jgi:LssY C-terminus
VTKVRCLKCLSLMGFPGSAFAACCDRGFFTALACLLLSLSFSSPTFASCEYVIAGKSFWIRLLDPVASYSSKPGTTVRAVLIQSPECDSRPVFPAGLEVFGTISKVRKVGLGFVHDSAYVEIRFDHLVTAAGQELSFAAEVVEADNAREVVRHNVFRGIRATDAPQGRITSGLIHMPTFNPYTDVGLIVYRAVTVLPEPEIYLPPGTDLRLRLNLPLYVGDQPVLPSVSFAMDEFERGDVEMLLQGQSDRTTTLSGKNADVVDLLFVGSRDQVEGAFAAAGWRTADANSKNAFFKQFGAFLTFSNYPNMPVSRQLLSGQVQDMAWQKSFNSYGKRSHIRLWSQSKTIQGEQAWLSAYTRETGAVLSVKYHKFIHHIDRNLDDGMNMLVRDLALAGCVEFVRQLPRPNFPQSMLNSTGDEMHTDGNLTVVHLKSCTMPLMQYSRNTPLIPVRPSSRFVRYLRTQVLLYKSDVIRGNIIYSAFELSLMSIRSLRHPHSTQDDENYDDLPIFPVSPVTLLPHN